MILSALTLAFSIAGGWACTPGWTQQGEAREFVADTLFEYINGNAEGYLVYGFAKMRGVTCVKGGVTVVADVSEFKDEEGAYGMLLSTLDPGAGTEKIGIAGQVVERRVVFAKGRYFAELSAEPEGDHAAALRELAGSLEKTLAGTGNIPEAVGWFPPGWKSVRFVPSSVLGIRGLDRGYMVEYAEGRAFLLRGGAEAFEKLRLRLKAGEAASEIGDASFQAADQYLGPGCYFRKGGIIGGALGGGDVCGRAKELAARLP
jgi:hypothetical protein